MPDESLLSVEGLSRRFGGLVAVRDVSFQVGERQIVGLIGPNGAGKTTLFRCIVGELRPSAGRVVFDGQPIEGISQHGAVRRGVCHTHQIPAPFADMTVRENVAVGAAFGRRVSGMPAEITERVLQRTGLDRLGDALARTLSIGNLKLLEVARALATQPRLLCLDEVGGGLTPGELERMLTLIRSIRDDDGVTVLYIEHNMRAVRAVCERIVVLDFGQKIAEGTPDEIARDPRVIEAYLGGAAVQQSEAAS